MISEILPDDIQNLILSLWNEKHPDAEMDKMLPPRFVRDALLAEKGVIAPRGEAQQELVRDWFASQTDAQNEAMRVQEVLQKVEPMTQELALKGDLPVWAVKPWAVTLLFDWSADLADAVGKANEYLLEHQKTPTR